MREDFGIGLRAGTCMAISRKSHSFNCLVILDHAVVDEGELAAGVEMWMRVLVGTLP